MSNIYRDFDPTHLPDGQALDVLLENNHHGNVQLDRDYVMVADGTGDFRGCIISRPAMYVHEFNILPSNSMIITAEGLLQFALSKASMMGERDAIFTVRESNDRMMRFIEDRGAVRQDDDKVGRLAVYTMSIPRRFYPRGQGK